MHLYCLEFISECADKEYTYLSAVDVCLKIFDDQKTWSYASDRCKADGGHLVMVDTGEKLQALNALIPINGSNLIKLSVVYFWHGIRKEIL